MPRLWFRMFDSAPQGGGAPMAISCEDEAISWNERGWGIYWTVNAFRDGVRRISHLEAVLAWATDLDASSKAEQRQRIGRAPLRPSLVVETRRGYHVYYGAKDGTSEGWDAIVRRRLIGYFGGDENASDLARILRVPGYDHCKDPSSRFRCEVVDEWPVAYRERDMLEAFPERAPRQAAASRVVAAAPHAARPAAAARPETPWDRLNAADQGELLLRLSGHPAMGGEHIVLREQSGVRKICVNGKSNSTWVDAQGRIGSLSGGGPTVVQWLQWYGLGRAQVLDVFAEVFPEQGWRKR